MGLEDFARDTFDRNITSPARRIGAEVKRAKGLDKAGALIANTGKEMLLLPVRNIAAVSNWALGKMGSLLSGTVGFGMRALGQVALPIGIGSRNSPSMPIIPPRDSTPAFQRFARIEENPRDESSQANGNPLLAA